MARRITVLAAAVALATVGAAAVAGPAQAAAPRDPAAVQPFTVVCSTGQRASLTLPVPGSYVPGSIDGADASLVPYRFDYRWTDGRGHVLIRSEALGKTGPVPRSAITCTLDPVAYPDGTDFSFTVTAVVQADR